MSDYVAQKREQLKAYNHKQGIHRPQLRRK